MGNGRGWSISRGTAAGLGVLGSLGGLALTLVLGFWGMWSGASAAAYPWPGDAAAAEAVLRAALVCLVAGVFDLTGAVAAWREDGRRASRLFRFAGGGFAVVTALSFWAATTASHGTDYGLFGIVGIGLALITPWWGRWPAP
jgi:hypothetical protein